MLAQVVRPAPMITRHCCRLLRNTSLAPSTPPPPTGQAAARVAPGGDLLELGRQVDKDLQAQAGLAALRWHLFVHNARPCRGPVQLPCVGAAAPRWRAMPASSCTVVSLQHAHVVLTWVDHVRAAKRVAVEHGRGRVGENVRDCAGSHAPATPSTSSVACRDVRRDAQQHTAQRGQTHPPRSRREGGAGRTAHACRT